MSEKMLKVILSAIPTILLILCVVAAFATQGWDVKRTMFAEDPQKTVESFFSPDIGAEEEFLEVTGFEISEDMSTLTIEAVVHSPFNLPVKIKELSAEVIMDSSTVPISLPSEVEVPAKGSANLELQGSLPKTQAQTETQMPPTSPSEEKQTLSSMKMTLDISGIVLEIDESRLGGVMDV